MTPLFGEIFQDTSAGDIGIEIANGPILRCHTHILQTECPGFLSKVRCCPPIGGSVMEHVPASSVDTEIRNDPAFHRLKPDLTFTSFAKDDNLYCMGGAKLDNMMALRKPGYSTATKLSGSIGSIRTRDVFFLAERYELHEPLDKVIELLRFIYLKKIAYVDMIPETPQEKENLQQAMLDMLYLSDKYCVDELFTLVVNWIRENVLLLCGEGAFVDTFFQIEYYHRERCQETLNKDQLNTLLREHLTERAQLRLITKDSRWMSLSCNLLEEILSIDELAIGSENEILGLIERWNGNGDKSKSDVVRLFACFRVCADTWKAYVSAVQNLGFPKPSTSILEEKGRKKPRNNLKVTESDEMMQELAEAQRRQQQELRKQRQEEREASFTQFEDGERLHLGFGFNLQEKQTIVQNFAVREAGTYRVRVAFSQSRLPLWDPKHELFMGVIFGTNRYQGFICGQSPYDGVFRLQSFSSAAPKPGPPMHLTGSGTKMEFDLELAVSMQRVNAVVCCTLSVMTNNNVSMSEFELRRDTLVNGTGLRFQILGTIPPPGVVDVSLAWVGGV